MRAVFADGAALQRMLDVEAALARAEAAAGVIPDTLRRSPSCAIAMRGTTTCRRCATRRAMRAIWPSRWWPHSRARSPPTMPVRAGSCTGGPRARMCSIRHWCCSCATRCTARPRPRPPRSCFARADVAASPHGARGPHVDATGVAHHARLEARRSARRRRPASCPSRRRALCHRGAAIRRRGRHARLARHPCAGRGRALAADLGLAVADVPWHTQRDRLGEFAATLGLIVATLGKLARDFAPRAVRGRRSVRGGRARPRRLVDDAAKAQSGRRGDRARRGHARARARGHDAHGRRAGARARPRQLARRMGNAAGDRTARRGRARHDGGRRRRSRSGHRAHAGQPRTHAGTDCSRKPCRWRSRPRSAATPPTRLWPMPAARPRRSAATCATSSPADAKVGAVLDDATLRGLFDPASYLGASDAFIDRVLARAIPKDQLMPFADLAEVRLHYRLDGPDRAPVLVLSNSLGTDLDMWEGAGRGVHRGLPRAALRHARPRPIVGAAGTVHDRAARTRCRRAARPSRARPRRLRRRLDGRHDRDVAGRARARARRQARSPTRPRASRRPTSGTHASRRSPPAA